MYTGLEIRREEAGWSSGVTTLSCISRGLKLLNHRHSSTALKELRRPNQNQIISFFPLSLYLLVLRETITAALWRKPKGTGLHEQQQQQQQKLSALK